MRLDASLRSCSTTPRSRSSDLVVLSALADLIDALMRPFLEPIRLLFNSLLPDFGAFPSFEIALPWADLRFDFNFPDMLPGLPCLADNHDVYLEHTRGGRFLKAGAKPGGCFTFPALPELRTPPMPVCSNTHEICVGAEGRHVYCYGNDKRCLFNEGDCKVDADCFKYVDPSSPDYTAAKFSERTPNKEFCPAENIPYDAGWKKEACRVSSAYDYQLSGQGEYCKNDYDVTTERDCEAAAVALNIIFDGARDGANDHRNCVRDGSPPHHVWFNTAGAAASPTALDTHTSICHAAPKYKYQLITERGVYCEDRLDVTTEQDCKIAAVALGIPFGGLWDGPDDHRSCVQDWNPPHHVWFNTAPSSQMPSPPPMSPPSPPAYLRFDDGTYDYSYEEELSPPPPLPPSAHLSICHTTPQWWIHSSRVYCADAFDVTTEHDCRAAAAALGATFEKAWHGPDDHRNCLLDGSPPHHVRFNTAGAAASPTALDTHKSICRTTATMVGDLHLPTRPDNDAQLHLPTGPDNDAQYYCTEGSGGTCYEASMSCFGSCPSMGAWKAPDYLCVDAASCYDGFQSYCASWSSNSGTFNGGVGRCSDGT